uniref:Predicted protein n=1 Tax=Hordeum vulgare subsp. vulgare TaxID=112509 RepID=F2E5V4_HORVV|nr:predicted protein [Hordeum vulgare subsp. vulgare]
MFSRPLGRISSAFATLNRPRLLLFTSLSGASLFMFSCSSCRGSRAKAEPIMSDQDMNHPHAHHTGKTGAHRFRNPWLSATSHGLGDVIKWQIHGTRPKLPEPGSLPVEETDWKAVEQPPPDAVQVTWIGHASFLVQFDGVNVLTDPIFSERCSPVSFAGPKRIVPPPFPTDRLPRVDAVIISHNHYDHLDVGTVKALRDKVGMWYVPLGIRSWLLDSGVKPERVVELDWWQEHALPVETRQQQQQQVGAKQDGNNSVRVVCTPCQHFSGRSLFDRDATLWASWSLVGPTKRFYFAGDTGYRSVPEGVEDSQLEALNLPICPVFKDIGEKLGPFDLACIPIGAYIPRWFMSPVHCNPRDAVDLHVDIRSKQSVGMHWGTFVLSDEPVLEPPVQLALELQAKALPLDQFVALRHGQTRAYRSNP